MQFDPEVTGNASGVGQPSEPSEPDGVGGAGFVGDSTEASPSRWFNEPPPGYQGFFRIPTPEGPLDVRVHPAWRLDEQQLREKLEDAEANARMSEAFKQGWENYAASLRLMLNVKEAKDLAEKWTNELKEWDEANPPKEIPPPDQYRDPNMDVASLPPPTDDPPTDDPGADLV